MDSILKRIECKLDLLLKDRQIMGEDGCMHVWKEDDLTKEDIELIMTASVHLPVRFKCIKCDELKFV